MQAIKDTDTEVDWTEYERRKKQLFEKFEELNPKQYEQKIKELAEELKI